MQNVFHTHLQIFLRVKHVWQCVVCHAKFVASVCTFLMFFSCWSVVKLENVKRSTPEVDVCNDSKQKNNKHIQVFGITLVDKKHEIVQKVLLTKKAALALLLHSTTEDIANGTLYSESETDKEDFFSFRMTTSSSATLGFQG